MQQLTIKLVNKLGLHARAAAKLVNTTSTFAADIRIYKNSQSANSKSIMAVMMLAASCGTELVFTATGQDEEQALDAIKILINNRFDEPE